MMGSVMHLSVTVNVAPDGAVVLSVRGEVDHANAGELRTSIESVLNTQRPHTIRVDLGLVTFIDSGGIGSLVGAHRMAQAGGAGLVITNVSPFVGRQLTVAGVSDLLGVPHSGEPLPRL
jgi:stage II sporulation protein AA (anti-sigma F factor antagonist)